MVLCVCIVAYHSSVQLRRKINLIFVQKGGIEVIECDVCIVLKIAGTIAASCSFHWLHFTLLGMVSIKITKKSAESLDCSHQNITKQKISC